MAERKGALYARQSITREGSESRENQVLACRAAAERYGVDIVTELVEPPSTSGYHNNGRDRLEWLRLLHLVRTRAIDCVVAYKTDRLSRGGGPGWAPLLEAFQSVGADRNRIVCTPDGWVSEFEIGIRAAMDLEESRKTSDRLKAVHERKAREGKPATNGGYRAYGYERDGITVNPAEAAVVREMARLVLAGSSSWAIANMLNARHEPTSGGKAWRGVTVRTILTSPRIAGKRSHHGALTTAAWPAILDPDTAAAVGAVLKDRTMPPNARKYLLSGLLTCGRCHQPLVARTADAHHARSYVCAKRPGYESCGGIRIVAEPVEALIIDTLFDRIDTPEFRAALAGQQDDRIQQEALADIDRYETRLAQLAAEFAPEMTDREWQAARSAVQGRIDAAQKRLAQAVRAHPAHDLAGNGGTLRGLWCAGAYDLTRQRAIITAVYDRIVICPPRVPGRKTFDPDRVQFKFR